MTINRATLPAEFFDRTSAFMLKQPEPQYLYAQIVFAANANAELRRAEALGISMDKVFAAKKLDAFKKALGEVSAAIDEQNALHDRGIAAMEKYGITLEQAGQKIKQTQMNATAEDLVKDFQSLVAIGVDTDTIIDKMGGSVGAFVQRSIEMGTSVPREMQGIIAKMIETGSLVDANGEKFTDLSQIPFAESINQGLSNLIAKLDVLIGKMGGDLPSAIGRIPRSVDVEINGKLNFPEGLPVPAMAAGGIVHRPTLALIGEAGPEAVVPLNGRQPLGGGGNTFNVSLSLNDATFDGYSSEASFARRVLEALSQEAERRGARLAFAGA